MANQKYTIFLDFTTGGSVKKIQQELARVSKDLQPSKLISLGFSDTEINKLKSDYSKFSDSISKSFNESTRKFNYEILRKSLAENNINVAQFEKTLNRAGISGKYSFDTINKGLYGFNQEVKKSQTLMDKLMFTFSNTARWRIANAALNYFTQSIQQAYYFSKDLDRSLTNISIVSGRTREEMAQFAMEANKAAKALSTTTTAYTEASLVFYQQGLATEAVQKMTEATITGSNITGESTQTMSELLTATMQGFQMTAEEAMSVTDKLAAVGAGTAADFYELATAMSKVASIANTAGVSIDQVNAQIATVISVTKEAPEIVGNSLKSMYSRMLRFKTDSSGMMQDEMGEAFSAPAVESALKAFSKGQISLFETTGKNIGQLRDMGAVVEDIGNAWQKTGDQESKMALATALGGTYHLNRIMALFNGWQMYEDAVTTSLEAEGTALRQNAIYMESYDGHLKQLKATAESLYTTILNTDAMSTFTHILAGLIEGLNTILKLMGGFSTLFGGGLGLIANAFAVAPITKFLGTFTKLRGDTKAFSEQQSKSEKEMALIRKVYSDERVNELEREFDAATEKRRLLEQENKDLEKQRQILEEILALKSGTSIQGRPTTLPTKTSGPKFKNALDAGDMAEASSLALQFANDYQNSLSKIGVKYHDLSTEAKSALTLIKKSNTDTTITVGELENAYSILTNELENNVVNGLKEVTNNAKNGQEAMDQLGARIQGNTDSIRENFEAQENLRVSSARSAEMTLKWQRYLSTATMALGGFAAVISNEGLSATEKFNQSLGLAATNLVLFSSDNAIDKFFTGYTASLGTAGQATTKFGAIFAGLGSAITKAILPMLALQIAVMAIVYAVEKVRDAIPSLKKTQEQLQKNNAELGSLENKIQEIESLGSNASETDKIKLGIYREQLRILEYQTKELEKQAAMQALFGVGVGGDGLVGEAKEFVGKDIEFAEPRDYTEPKEPKKSDYYKGQTILPNGQPSSGNPTVDFYNAQQEWQQYKTNPDFEISVAITEESKDKALKDNMDLLIDLEKQVADKKANMAIYLSTLDPKSQEYKDTQDAMDSLTDYLASQYAEAAEKSGISVEEIKKKVEDTIAVGIPGPTYDLSNVIAYQKELDKLAGIKDKLRSSDKVELEDIQYLIDKYPDYADQIKANLNNKKALLGIIENIQKTNKETELDNASIALETAKRSRDEIKQTSDREIALAKENKQLLINNALKLGASPREVQGRVNALDNQIAQAEAANTAADELVKTAQAFYDAILNATSTTSSSGTDKWKEKFENDLKDLKYSFDKGIITAEQYYKQLEALNEKYFAKGKNKKYKDEYRQYELEALDGLRQEYKRQYDERLENSKNWIQQQKKLGKLSSDEEIAAWERVKTYTIKYYNDAIKAAGTNKNLRIQLEKELAKQLMEFDDQILENRKEKLKEQVELYEEQKDAVDDLLEKTEELIKFEKEGQKKVYEARKKNLEALRDEQEYKDSITKKTKALAELEYALKMAERDTTESGLAKQIELRQSIADLKGEIADEEAQNEFDLKQEALDKEIDSIDEYLDKTGQLTADAMKRIEKDIKDGTTVLKDELIAWNRTYGTSIDSDITNMWDKAKAGFDRFGETVRTSGIAAAIRAIADEIANLNKQLNGEIPAPTTKQLTKAEAAQAGADARTRLRATGYNGSGITELDNMNDVQARAWYNKWIVTHKTLTDEQKGYFLDIVEAKEAWAKAQYANGGFSTKTQVATLHGTQSSPEWIFNNDQLKTLLASAVYNTRTSPMISIPNAGNIQSPGNVQSNVTFDFANMITINGNADGSTVQSLKEASAEIANVVINKINNQLKLNGQYVLTSK